MTCAPGCKRQPGLSYCLPDLPAARVRHVDRPGAIDTVDLHVEPGARADDSRPARRGRRCRRSPRSTEYSSSHSPGRCPPDVVTATRVGRCSRCPHRRSILPAGIAGGRVDVATRDAPSSKRSACTVPGSATGVPPIRRGAGAGDGEAGASYSSPPRRSLPCPCRTPAESTCAPAVSDRPVFVNVCQTCQPPVFGTLIGPVRSIPSISIGIGRPSPRFATRTSRTYVPALATVTEELEPLPRTCPPDVVAAAGVVVLSMSTSVVRYLPAAVAGGGVEVCDTRPALVEALRLHRAWERHRRAAERRGAGACGREAEPVIVPHPAVLRRARRRTRA